MSDIVIQRADIQGPFITPPEHKHKRSGPSFACTEDYIIKSAGGAFTAFRWPSKGSFEPWNREPKLGRQVGPAGIK